MPFLETPHPFGSRHKFPFPARVSLLAIRECRNSPVLPQCSGELYESTGYVDIPFLRLRQSDGKNSGCNTGGSRHICNAVAWRLGDNAYAMEELIAELGAAFLCAALGIAIEPRRDHAAYVDSWLKVLQNDDKAIFTAAAQAQKAVEYLASVAKTGGWRMDVPATNSP